MSYLDAVGLGLKLGDKILRSRLHDMLGGQTQSGISPSSAHPVLMLFSVLASGEKYGYADGWGADNLFHYSGEGAHGDQLMKRGNKAIRDHVSAKRELHLFLGNSTGKPVTYAGQFEYVDHYETNGPEFGNGPLRSIIVFRLKPLDAMQASNISRISPAQKCSVSSVAVEQHLTEKMALEPERKSTEAERREAALVQQYKFYVESQQRRLIRHKIYPEDEVNPLFTDLFDVDRNMLIEAKGTVTREDIRMALGQLLDYVRFINPRPRMAVLVPSPLRHDLRVLLHQNNISVIEWVGDEFVEHSSL